MRRRDFIALSASAALSAGPAGSALARLKDRDGAAERMTWKPLRLGAGGFLTGVDIAADGSLAVRTDTYGGYIWEAERGEWRQLVTAKSMPAEYLNVDHHAGLFELVFAPTDSRVLYMYVLGAILKSTNRGVTWSPTGFVSVAGANANDDFRTTGPAMAVDPGDASHVIAGSPMNGLWRSTDGGQSFAQITSVPAGSGAPGVQNIIFDPNSKDKAGRTPVVYCAVTGLGVFRSDDAGANWSELPGGPVSFLNRVAVAGDGAFYATSGSTGVWKFAGGRWTSLGDPGQGRQPHSITADPKNPQRIVLGCADGTLAQSLDGGATWGEPFLSVLRRAADIPWLQWTKEDWMSNGDIRFHPTQQNRLVFAQGIGFWMTDLLPTANPQADSVIWQSQSKGIEQLVANQIVSTPGANPVLAAWDRPLWYIADADDFPDRHGPDNRVAILHGRAIDYAAPDPGFICAVIGRQNPDASGEPDLQSGFSTDGGRSWKPFAALPPWAGGNGQGTIAAASASNMVWVPAGGRTPYHTKDGGRSWSPAVLPGVAAAALGGLFGAFYLRRHNVCADRVLRNTFYLCHTDLGLFRSRDGGQSWSHVFQSSLIPGRLGYHAKLKAVPGFANHLWLTAGHQGGIEDFAKPVGPLLRSKNGGESWQTISGVTEVYDFGFGKPRRTNGYPTLFIFGWVDGVSGVYRSDDQGASWALLSRWPLDSLDQITCVEGDKDEYGKVYIGFGGSGFAYGRIAG